MFQPFRPCLAENLLNGSQGSLEVLWAAPGGPLELSGDLLEHFLAAPEGLWAALGASASERLLVSSWRLLGAFWGTPGAFWAAPVAGRLLGPCLTHGKNQVFYMFFPPDLPEGANLPRPDTHQHTEC